MKEGMIAAALLAAAYSMTGCGVQVGTTDYFREYNRSLMIAGAKKGSERVEHEHLTDTDREELQALLDGKRK